MSHGKVFVRDERDDDMICNGDIGDAHFSNCKNVLPNAEFMPRGKLGAGIWEPQLVDRDSGRIRTFSYNLISKEKSTAPSKGLYCDSEPAESWLKRMSDLRYDPWWDASVETEPMPPIPGSFTISFSHLAMCGASNHYLLSNRYGKLSEGVMAANGSLDLTMDSIESPEAWATTLQLTMGRHKIDQHRVLGKTLGRPGFVTREETLEIYFRLRRGLVSGPVQMFGLLGNEGCNMKYIQAGLGFIGYYKEGRPVGQAWKGLVGGWIHGKAEDENGRTFSGERIAYLYDDGHTALVGHFNNSIMLNAKETEVTGSYCDENGIKVLQFSDQKGSSFRYSPQTNVSFGDNPLIEDPLHKRYLEVRESAWGEGTYALRDIPAGKMIAIYGGRVYDSEQYQELTKENAERVKKLRKAGNLTDMELEDIWEASFKYRLKGADGCIDIPPEFGDRKKYRATIAHKVNDMTHNSHATYVAVDHPRFGRVMGLKSYRSIKKGEEVYAFYGYLGGPGSPRWYNKALLQKFQMSRMQKSQFYWPVPITHFDRVFCDKVGWSNFTVSSNLKKWMAYAGWKRHQSPWTTGQLWNSINPKKRDVYIFLSFLSKQAPMDFTIANSQGLLRSGTMVEGRIAFKLVESDKVGWWNDSLQIRLTKQQSRSNTELKEIEVYARLKDGRVDGILRMFGKIPNEPSAFHHILCREDGLGFIGYYKKGKLVGPSWRGLIGGGWLYGVADDKGELTGPNIAYVYPDLTTALLGHFQDGKMVNARAVEVIGERCNIYGVKELQFSIPEGPTYQYTPQTKEDFGHQKLTGDPLERKNVFVGPSSWNDGLFAKQLIPEGTVFALYGGHILTREQINERIESYRPHVEQWVEAGYDDKKLRNLYENTWAYRFSVTIKACDRSIDIPFEFGNDLNKYNATLGHKINHGGGVDTNSNLIAFDSPRFGLINGVVATRNIQKGSQIFLSYVYPPTNSPSWYEELNLKMIREFETKFG